MVSLHINRERFTKVSISGGPNKEEDKRPKPLQKKEEDQQFTIQINSRKEENEKQLNSNVLNKENLFLPKEPNKEGQNKNSFNSIKKTQEEKVGPSKLKQYLNETLFLGGSKKTVPSIQKQSETPEPTPTIKEIFTKIKQSLTIIQKLPIQPFKIAMVWNWNVDWAKRAG